MTEVLLTTSLVVVLPIRSFEVQALHLGDTHFHSQRDKYRGIIMNLTEEIRSVLELGGYRTARGPATLNAIYFEDATIVGVVFLYDSVSDLVGSWEKQQDSFLGSNSHAIRSNPIKAWNIYTVHLTSDHGQPQQLSEAFGIEQDFRGTRKIVRAGLSKKADVREALLPYCPYSIGPRLRRLTFPNGYERD